MAWGLRGTPTTGRITAGSGSQDVTLPSGTTTGDLVCVAVSGDISCADSITTAGYTLAENGTGANPGAHFGYKVMGASPDSVVAIARDGTILKSCVVMTFSGGLSNDILDTSINTAVTATSADADCGAIVTKTANALVVVVAHLDDDDSTVSTWPTGYSTWSVSERTTDGPGGTVGSTTAMCAAVVAVAGSENPGILSFSSVDANSVSAIAFRSTTYHQPFKSDTAMVTDSTPVVSLVLVPVVSDAVGISDIERQTKLEPLLKASTDTVSVTETATVERKEPVVEPATLSVTDSVAVEEVKAEKLEPLLVSKSDAIAITEVIAQDIPLVAPLTMSLSDQVSTSDIPYTWTEWSEVSEFTTSLLSDAVSVQDQPSAVLSTNVDIAITDDIYQTDASAQELDFLFVSQSDAVATSELITSEKTGEEIPLDVTSQDTTAITDNASHLLIPLCVSSSDSVGMSESISQDFDLLDVDVSDAIDSTEVITRELVEGSFMLAFGDASSVSESISMDVYDVPMEIELMDIIASFEKYPIRTIPNPLMALGHKSQDLTIQ